MINNRKSFEEWIKNPKHYEKLYRSLYTKPRFEQYRHITQENLINILENHKFDYPRQVIIPKDINSFREVFLYNPIDNLILKFYNNYLNEIYADAINTNVYSYKENISVATTIRKFYEIYDETKSYVKIDLTNYFMTPEGDILINFLEKFDLNKHPFNSLFDNKYYDAKTKELKEKNLGLLPGAPLSAFLSNAFMKPFDDYVSHRYNKFFRYSDDFIIECEPDNVQTLISDLTQFIENMGLKINSKKTIIFKPYEPVVFLGVEISKNGFQLSIKRIQRLKGVIKKLAKTSAKLKKSPDERIKHFLRKIYQTIFKAITKDIFRGGLCSTWFSCSSVYDRIQLIDYYILDKCRYIYSRKTNFGALNKGIDTLYLENLGFVSLVSYWHMYKESPLIMAFESFKHINYLDAPRSTQYYVESLTDVSGTFDVLDLLMQSSDRFSTQFWNIGSKQITFNNEVLFDKDKLSHRFTDKCIVTIASHYGTISEEDFIGIFRTTSFKQLERQSIVTKLFNPVLHTRLPYYSYLNTSRNSAIQLASCFLFLYNIGKLEIEFTDTSKPYLIYTDTTVKFITDNEYYNVVDL